MEKKNISYIGIVGRNQTCAVSRISADNLDFRTNKVIYKFPKDRYYEAMYKLAAVTVEEAIAKNVSCIIYTVDALVDNVRAFFKAYNPKKSFDFRSFAESKVAYKREFEGADNELIDYERDNLAELLKTVAKSYVLENMTLRIEKAKEADQLILDVPDDVKLLEGDVLTFEKGRTHNGITVLGWPAFERKAARVKAKIETGKASPTYFIYKNDRTKLGMAKGDMLRYLWAYCPNNDPETYNTLSRIA